MELATQILGLLAGVISLTTAVLAVIFKNKNSETLESFQKTKIIAKNNSNVINNSPNSTITQTTINNSKPSSSSNTFDGADVIGFMVLLFAVVTAVAALYTQHEKTVYFIVIIECLILALLSIFGTLKHNIGIHETILSMLAIFEGIFVPFVFKHLFWVKFVGAEFTKKTDFTNFAERMAYLFENKAYLFYNIYEFLSVTISIVIISCLIFTIGRILLTRQRKRVKMYCYFLTLFPILPFLAAEFFLLVDPSFFNSIK